MIFPLKVLKKYCFLLELNYTYDYLYFFTYYNGNKYYISTIENFK